MSNINRWRKGRPVGGKREAPGNATELRIIGGSLGGRKIAYHGDPGVRPMKHRVREAIFNLISDRSKGRYAIDLFAGTGALGLEAISRGAVGATFIERHVPTSRVVRSNIGSLALELQTVLRTTSAFLWAERDLEAETEQIATDYGLPWLVFCSPPYLFFVDRIDEMNRLLTRILEAAPAQSVIVVEGDQRFDPSLLPSIENQSIWDVRDYPPARVAVTQLGDSSK